MSLHCNLKQCLSFHQRSRDVPPISVFFEHDVCWLDVPMSNAILMKMANTSGNLPKEISGFFFIKTFLIFKQCQQISLAHQLRHNLNLPIFIEEIILKNWNHWMAAKGLKQRAWCDGFLRFLCQDLKNPKFIVHSMPANLIFRIYPGFQCKGSTCSITFPSVSKSLSDPVSACESVGAFLYNTRCSFATCFTDLIEICHASHCKQRVSQRTTVERITCRVPECVAAHRATHCTLHHSLAWTKTMTLISTPGNDFPKDSPSAYLSSWSWT